jgi:ABC-type bacteriocin/lantibiotic exporter with double-glycine peptidase domain
VMALAFVPVLVLPLLLVLQELERWALQVPEESARKQSHRLESGMGPRTSVRQPGGAG